MRTIAGQYRLFERERAEDAVNVELCRDVCDAEARIRISGSGRISVCRAARRAMRRRSAEEDALHTAFARETVQLRMLQRRLTDPALGLVWWVDRYADLQFAAGDPKAKVISILAAFQTLRETADDADDRDAEPRVQIRRAAEEILNGVEDRIPWCWLWRCYIEPCGRQDSSRASIRGVWMTSEGSADQGRREG
ncbi:hypothetical protein MRQ36_02410 [Micromonospora sp. R77]|uniref:hypothetical protein n=1 Tax=Micromonospora sp. R77 TaxID=2925836 RepID=UPI001F6080D3|nr:hypothetical protein [Micromonospora sp. R77]MCI4061489.1 hypothetical protein [Micromonospora sp. R77]